MTKVSGPPKLSGMKYRVVNTLGNGAGSTILLIADKTAGGKRYALKVVRKQEPEDEVFVQQALTEFEASKKLNHSAIAKVFDCRNRGSRSRGSSSCSNMSTARPLTRSRRPSLVSSCSFSVRYRPRSPTCIDGVCFTAI